MTLLACKVIKDGKENDWQKDISSARLAPARIGQIVSQVLISNRSVDFFAVPRGKPFWHENDGKNELYMIEEVPFAYTTLF
jgi:hypothetical protein